MAAYVMGTLKIHDREEYGKYEAGILDILSGYQCEFLAVDDDAEVLEGEWPYTRTVVLKFSSAEEARRWWNSPEYQSLAEHRRRASTGNIVFVEGLPLS